VITSRNVEQEVNKIRLEIYEETKNMTPEQRRERLERITLDAQRQFGFKRIARAKDKR
jgi:hypothetical protein